MSFVLAFLIGRFVAGLFIAAALHYIALFVSGLFDKRPRQQREWYATLLGLAIGSLAWFLMAARGQELFSPEHILLWIDGFMVLLVATFFWALLLVLEVSIRPRRKSKLE